MYCGVVVGSHSCWYIKVATLQIFRRSEVEVATNGKNYICTYLYKSNPHFVKLFRIGLFTLTGAMSIATEVGGCSKLTTNPHTVCYAAVGRIFL